MRPSAPSNSEEDNEADNEDNEHNEKDNKRDTKRDNKREHDNESSRNDDVIEERTEALARELSPWEVENDLPAAFDFRTPSLFRGRQY